MTREFHEINLFWIEQSSWPPRVCRRSLITPSLIGLWSLRTMWVPWRTTSSRPTRRRSSWTSSWASTSGASTGPPSSARCCSASTRLCCSTRLSSKKTEIGLKISKIILKISNEWINVLVCIPLSREFTKRDFATKVNSRTWSFQVYIPVTVIP